MSQPKTSTTPVRLAVAGAGLIGRRHVDIIASHPDATLAAVIDPAPAGKAFAESHAASWFPDLETYFASAQSDTKPDGLIVATPNQSHVADGLLAIAAGVPVLVEKPVADSAASGRRLVEAAETAGVAILVGHHRRHSPLIARAKEIITSGRLGRIVAVHAFFWLVKPDDYYDVSWRREPGGGPVLINLIHDIDLMRHLVGEIVSVQAIESRAQRNFAVEDTAAMLLRFANGAIGTVTVSDTIVAPWSWEQTSGENKAYPETGQTSYFIGGTEGSLTAPKLEVWSSPGVRSWWEPIEAKRLFAPEADPLVHQITNFAAVIRGQAVPVASGREGLKTLAVIEALKTSAAENRAVDVAKY